MPNRLPLAALLLSLATLVSAQQEHQVTSYGLVLEVPEMKKVKVTKGVKFSGDLAMNVYYPGSFKKGQRLPVVVFINGVGDRPGDHLKDWEIYKSWPTLMAANGYVSLCHDAKSESSGEDLKALFSYLTKNALELGIDEKKMGAWACSANVRTAVPYLMESAEPGISCGVLYYGFGQSQTLRKDLPVLLVRAGKDNPQLNTGIDVMLRQVQTQGAPWSFLNAPNSHHAFDALDDTDESRAAIRQTVDYFDQHLKPAVGNAVAKSSAREALSYWFGQEYGRAAVAYEAYSKEHPADGVAKLRWGASLRLQGKLEQALPILEEAAKLSPDGETYMELATAYQGLRRSEDALKYLDLAISKLPDFAEAYARRGALYSSMNRPEDAERSLLKAVELNPRQGLYLFQLGSTQLTLKKYDAAIDNLTKAGASFPHPSTYYNLACAYALANRKESAFEALNKAIEVGFRDKNLLASDPDIALLREDSRFEDVLKKIPG